MTRLQDWSSRLDKYLAMCERRQFAWGAFDCAMFTIGAIQAVTGVDLGGKWRDSYHDAYTAGRVVGISGLDLDEIAARELTAVGCREVEPYFAKRGDVVVADVGSGVLALGVVSSRGIAVVDAPVGLATLPISSAKRAWVV